MNERIWQLQGQAKVLAEQHIAHRKFDDVMEYRQVLYDTTMNKFAELIVRECLYNMENCDGDLDFAIWKTKQDFGVKE